MGRVTRVAVLGCWAAAVMAEQQPAFDAASVRVVKLASRPAFGNSGGPGSSDPSRIHLCCVGMFSLLMRAYDVQLDQISAPAWVMDNMGPNLYQIDATMPADTTAAQFQLMMRSLLEERFHLKIHREKRSFAGYALVVQESGAKLRESKPGAPAAGPVIPGLTPLPPGPQIVISLGRGMVVVRGQEKPIADLVKGMGRLIAQAQGEDPNDFSSPKPRVLDRTGLTGKYDFTLRFACDACQFGAVNGAAAGPPPSGEVGADAPNLFVAIERQLGLSLVKTRDIVLETIVVDHVEKTPTAN